MAELTATLHALNSSKGAVRVEQLYDTGIDDLWQACTHPDRLARWLAQVSGDLQVGGLLQMTFTSTFTGPARIEVCEPPHHLLLTSEPGTDEQTELEAWLTEEGNQTRLVIEDRGLSLDSLHFHGAGWQAHLEDLTRSLTLNGPVHPEVWTATEAAPAWHKRWSELTPRYETLPVE